MRHQHGDGEAVLRQQSVAARVLPCTGTGAGVVGQQPFGGGRASATNDEAGSILNLRRWTSPRSIKETFVPATDHRYPHTD